jgi:hypothetical protein
LNENRLHRAIRSRLQQRSARFLWLTPPAGTKTARQQIAGEFSPQRIAAIMEVWVPKSLSELMELPELAE